MVDNKLHHLMANFAAELDLHKEAHMAKNVADNDSSAHVEAAKKGLMFCKHHPGMWISIPRMVLLSPQETALHTYIHKRIIISN